MFKDLALLVIETIWIQKVLDKHHIVVLRSPFICYDNISTFYMVKHPIFHAKIKHVEIDFCKGESNCW